jgi:hypothetical protein
MKSVFKVLGVIALVAVIGFSMTACPTGDNDDGGNNGGGNAVIGAKLELSGQVYTMVTNQANYTITYPEYKGNLTLSDNIGGNVTITSGKLSYTIETPSNLVTWDYIQDDYFYNYDNVTVSDQNVKFFSPNFNKYDANTSYSLSKRNMSVNIGNTSGTQTFESVMYVYVDKDVTVTGKGKTETDTEDGRTSTHKTNNFSLALKNGWNAIYTKSIYSATYPAGNPSAATSTTGTETISLSNPALKWVLDIYSDDYGSK